MSGWLAAGEPASADDWQQQQQQQLERVLIPLWRSGQQAKPSGSELQQQQQQLRRQLKSLEPQLRHLDQEAGVLGLRGVFHADASGCVSLDVAGVVQDSLQLVVLYQRSRESRESLEDRVRCLESELRDCRRKQQRMQEASIDSDCGLAEAREKERRLTLQNRSLAEQCKELREEARRLGQQLQQRDSQYRHEKRKLAKEADRLKERLHGCLTNSLGPLRSSCIEILNPLPRADGRRAAWARPHLVALQPSDEPPQYQKNYQLQLESRQTELVEENQELKESLYRVHLQLAEADRASAVPEAEEQEESSVSASKQPVGDSLQEGLLKLPYQLVKERVDRELQERCSSLVKRVSSASSLSASLPTPKAASESPDELLTEEMDQLRERLRSYESIIQRQEQLIKRFGSRAAAAGVAD